MLDESKAYSGFAVPDLEAAKTFYGEALGLSVKTLMEDVLIQIGGDHPVLVYQKDDHRPANYTILNFPVSDVDAAVDALAGAASSSSASRASTRTRRGSRGRRSRARARRSPGSPTRPATSSPSTRNCRASSSDRRAASTSVAASGAYATPRFTQGSSWRLVRTPSASTRSHPSIGRPRISKGFACGLARSASVSQGRPAPAAAMTAGGHRHVAVDQEGEPAEHRRLGDLGLAGDQLADAVGEVLVVRHAVRLTESPSGRRGRPDTEGDVVENVEVAARFYEPATSKSDLLRQMPRTMALPSRRRVDCSRGWSHLPGPTALGKNSNAS